MAQMIVVRLIDDIDGGEADETVSFALDGKAYEIELSKKNAASLRKLLAPYIESGRTAGRPPSPGRGRSSGSQRSVPGSKTLFSQLSVEERERFRSGPICRLLAGSATREFRLGSRPAGRSCRMLLAPTVDQSCAVSSAAIPQDPGAAPACS